MQQFANEYEYLVHLLQCAISDEQPVEKPAELSFEKVFEYGRTHEVANIAYVSLLKLKKHILYTGNVLNILRNSKLMMN